VGRILGLGLQSPGDAPLDVGVGDLAPGAGTRLVGQARQPPLDEPGPPGATVFLLMSIAMTRAPTLNLTGCISNTRNQLRSGDLLQNLTSLKHGLSFDPLTSDRLLSAHYATEICGLVCAVESFQNERMRLTFLCPSFHDASPAMDSIEDDRPIPELTTAEVTHVDPVTIGRYRVTRALGQGGFGRVYLAHDDELDRWVAIKVPGPGHVDRPEEIDSFLTEARILAKLDHPHIVPAFDVGRMADGSCYVVSKYVEGSDLAEKILRGRPDFCKTAELIAKIAEALHYAHTRGLVHRDIKPANILIDSKGNPCVADFGLALKDDNFGRDARTAGTPAYMSPEQARGDGNRVDGRSDIFSLGVVFYELLVGHRPFRGKSQAEVLDQIINVEARPPRQIDDEIPIEMERICLKALSKQPTLRYSTALDMAEDIRTCLHPHGGEATSSSATSDTSRIVGERSVGRSDKRVAVRGNLGRLGCGIELSLALSIVIAFLNFYTIREISNGTNELTDIPTSHPMMDSSDPPINDARSDRLQKPTLLDQLPAMTSHLAMFFIYALAAFGIIWFFIKTIMLTIRLLILLRKLVVDHNSRPARGSS
jgi:serine/threonine protein kinase